MTIRDRPADAAVASATRRRRGGPWRGIGAVVALVVFLVALPLAITAVWVNLRILDGDGFVAEVDSLGRNERVIAGLSNAVTDQINARLLRLEGRYPRLVGAAITELGGVDAVQAQIAETVTAALNSPEFGPIWTTVNREGHDAIVGVLRGQQQGLLLADEEHVYLDVLPIVALLTQDPTSNVSRIIQGVVPRDADLTVVLFKHPDLVWAERFVRYEGTVALVCGLLAVAALALFLWLARARRRALMWAGAATAVVMVLVYLAVSSVIGDQLAKVEDAAARNLADEFVAALLTRLNAALLVAAAVGAAVFVAAWLSGRWSRRAVELR